MIGHTSVGIDATYYLPSLKDLRQMVSGFISEASRT